MDGRIMSTTWLEAIAEHRERQAHEDAVADGLLSEPTDLCYCGSDTFIFLGRLGRLDHYRCRNCGLDRSEIADAHRDNR